MKGSLFHATLKKEQLLSQILNLLKNPITLQWDRGELQLFNNAPTKIKPEGSSFSKEGEIRWEKRQNHFHVLLFTENLSPPSPFIPCQGDWETERKKIPLISLHNRRYSPPFSQYPNSSSPRPYLCGFLYKQKQIPFFFSPREIEE